MTPRDAHDASGTHRSTHRPWLWSVLALAVIGLAAAAWWRGFDARLFDSGSRVHAVGGEHDDGSGLARLGRVPDFAFVSQTGDTVRLADLHGTLWIADFIFTHCASSCPMMTAQLGRLSSAFDAGNDVRFVSFSVDPERDTPERLSEFAAGYGADPQRWLFLTGRKAALYALIEHGFKLSVQKSTPEEIAAGAEPVLHSTRFVLVDWDGEIRGYYNGLDEVAMQELGRAVERLRAIETQ